MSGTKRKMVLLSEGDRYNKPHLVEKEVTIGDDIGIAVVRHKTMEEILRENPTGYFDSNGNFCCESGQLHPKQFHMLGHTFHKAYIKDAPLKDRWWYTVIDL